MLDLHCEPSYTLEIRILRSVDLSGPCGLLDSYRVLIRDKQINRLGSTTHHSTRLPKNKRWSADSWVG